MILVAALWTSVLVNFISVFWKNIVDFLKKVIKMLKPTVKGILYGCKVLVRKLREGVEEISRNYSKIGEHWEETTVTRTVPESEVPPDILKRAKSGKELDITDELEMQLSA